MKKLTFVVLVVASISTISGCANFSPTSSANSLESGKSYWLSYDASRRGALVIAEGQKIKTCAEPAPDVALSFVNTLKGSLSTPSGVSATGVEAALNATAQALAGRDDVVLLAREALFRICEASINGNIKSEDVKPLFQDVFEQVKQIAVEQAKTAKSKAVEAEAEVQKAKLKSESLSK